MNSVRVELTWGEMLRILWLRLRFSVREMNYAVGRVSDPRVRQ